MRGRVWVWTGEEHSQHLQLRDFRTEEQSALAVAAADQFAGQAGDFATIPAGWASVMIRPLAGALAQEAGDNATFRFVRESSCDQQRHFFDAKSDEMNTSRLAAEYDL